MNTRTTPKDFFFYVASTVALYAGVISLINLSFSIINYAFPDVLASGYYVSNLAWPMSMVLVLIPVFYVLERLIAKDIRLMPEKGTLLIRKWRTYLTLFLTGATIIGDIVALFNVYLSGEISTRFIWKILTVLVIAGVVFAYYILDNREGDPRAGQWRRILAYAGIALSLAALIGGFVIVGSPGKQRDLRLDMQRTNDLQNLQWQIISYWQNKGALPNALDDVKDSISYSKFPVDPVTKEPYGYNRVASTTFTLCADFARESQDIEGRGQFYGRGMPSIAFPAYDGGLMPEGDDAWKHEAGNACFERKIDPDRYPVNPRPTPPKTI